MILMAMELMSTTSTGSADGVEFCNDLDEALRRALAANGPFVVDVIVDRNDEDRVGSRRIVPTGTHRWAAAGESAAAATRT
jgi:hypothetical protein